MEELVELLAENTHNVWAKERIQQGWTYALSEVQYFINAFQNMSGWNKIYNSVIIY